MFFLLLKRDMYLKSCILYEIPIMTFWKRQDYGDGKKLLSEIRRESRMTEWNTEKF